MTFIRRAAQLMQDLKELGILPDGCEIKSNFVKGDLLIGIKFPEGTRYETIDSINEAIKEEFKDVEVEDWGGFSRQNVKVIISKYPITSLKMTQSYKYF